MNPGSDALQPPPEVAAALDHGVTSIVLARERAASEDETWTDAHLNALRTAVNNAHPENTLRAYQSDWRQWTAWCKAEGRTPLPARPLDVAIYLAVAAETGHTRRSKATGEDELVGYAPKTLSRWLDGIAAVHRAAGLPSPTKDVLVAETMAGIRRLHHRRPDRKRPLLLAELRQILDNLPADTWPTGVLRRRNRLILLTGLAGGLRRVELASISVDDVEPAADPETGGALLIVHLGITKTDVDGRYEEAIVLPRGDRVETCPVCAYVLWVELLEIHHHGGKTALRAHYQQMPALPQGHVCGGYQGTQLADGSRVPLFPRVYHHGAIGPAMSGQAVANVVKMGTELIGLDPDDFAGHSLRAGFATQAALGGAFEREIMRQGRWSSTGQLQRYIRMAAPTEGNAVTKLGL